MMKNSEKSLGSCACGSLNCCSREREKRKIVIDFLFLDLNVCTRCQGADDSLDQAINEVSKILESTGIDVVVNKINVISKELALQYQFLSSPTIRVNGNDIQMEIKESLCESCGDLCGDEVDCRVWTYQGQEFSVPPKAMISEGILKEVFGNSDYIASSGNDYVLPENLKNFYEAMNNKDI